MPPVEVTDGAALASDPATGTTPAASLVVVSQQTPDNSMETQRRNGLSFASLVDAGGKVAHAFGLRWKVSDELRAVEEGCGMDLAAFNGDPSWTLTMPARYVVAPGGMIEYADISVDYTRRGDPSELIPVLAHLAAHYRFQKLQKACPHVQTNRPGHSNVCLEVESMRHDYGMLRHVVQCKCSSA